MSRTTQTQLRAAFESHTQAIRDFQACVGRGEQAPAIERLQRTGSALIELVEGPLRATVRPELVSHCHSSLDRSFHIIGRWNGWT